MGRETEHGAALWPDVRRCGAGRQHAVSFISARMYWSAPFSRKYVAWRLRGASAVRWRWSKARPHPQALGRCGTQSQGVCLSRVNALYSCCGVSSLYIVAVYAMSESHSETVRAGMNKSKSTAGRRLTRRSGCDLCATQDSSLCMLAGGTDCVSPIRSPHKPSQTCSMKCTSNNGRENDSCL